MEEIEPYVRRKRVNPVKSNKLIGLNEEVNFIIFLKFFNFFCLLASQFAL